jgi:hypothetical protein
MPQKKLLDRALKRENHLTKTQREVIEVREDIKKNLITSLHAIKDDVQRELGFKVILALYIAGDTFMPTYLRCLAAPGAKYRNAASHFLRNLKKDLDVSGQRQFCAERERFYPDAQLDDLREESGEIAKSLIAQDEKFRIFGDFVDREQVKSRARFTQCGDEGFQTILTVNFCDEVTDTAWWNGQSKRFNKLFEEVAHSYPLLPETYKESDHDYFPRFLKITEKIRGLLLDQLAQREHEAKQCMEDILVTLIDGFSRKHKSGRWYATIHRLVSQDQKLSLEWHAPPWQPIPVEKDFHLGYGKGVITWVAVRSKAIRINNLKTSEFADIHCRYFDLETQSQLAAPIVIGRQVLGVLNLESTIPDAFDDDSMGFLSRIADELVPILYWYDSNGTRTSLSTAPAAHDPKKLRFPHENQAAELMFPRVPSREGAPQLAKEVDTKAGEGVEKTAAERFSQKQEEGMPRGFDEMGLEQEAKEAAKALFGESVPAETVEEVRETLRLHRQHPGRHVAFVDTWLEGKEGLRLQRRVLCEAADPIELEAKIEGLPDDERRAVRTRYIAAPLSPVSDRGIYQER